jgi:hypothetical protein
VVDELKNEVPSPRMILFSSNLQKEKKSNNEHFGDLKKTNQMIL